MKEEILKRLLKNGQIFVNDIVLILSNCTWDINNLLQDLYDKKIISEEEVFILLKNEKHFPNFPNISEIDYYQDPIISKNNHYEHCSCNPKNGGSGVCQCTLGTKDQIRF